MARSVIAPASAGERGLGAADELTHRGRRRVLGHDILQELYERTRDAATADPERPLERFQRGPALSGPGEAERLQVQEVLKDVRNASLPMVGSSFSAFLERKQLFLQKQLVSRESPVEPTKLAEQGVERVA